MRTLHSIALLAIASTTIFATTASALTASQLVQREVIITNIDGSKTTKLEAADKVTPGDKVVYSLNYFNDAADAADNIVLVMPIPNEVSYLDGSADNNVANTTYSVDAGQTFANRNDLRVKLANQETRAASATDITHIKWIVRTPVAPNTGGTLAYSGRLK